MTNRKWVYLYLILLIFIILISGCTKKTVKTDADKQVTPKGKLVVTVIDKESKKPVDSAGITILGNDGFYKTDEKGRSPIINVDINKDIYKKYGEVLTKKASSGSCSILVTKEGYKDFIYFNKAVYQGEASNTLKIEMANVNTKSQEKNDMDYTTFIEAPHSLWVQDLIMKCQDIKDVNQGKGQNQILINILDEKAKPIEGAFAVIPEQDLKVKSDKEGKCALKPDLSKAMNNMYTVKKEKGEVTIIVLKEGYVPFVLLDKPVEMGKDASIDIKLKPSKNKDREDYLMNIEPYDGEWVKKIIEAYKTGSWSNQDPFY